MARILLIDDDEAIRIVGTQMLRFLGHEVVTAGDGLDGLNLVKRAAFDLVITDMRMPGIDGLQVIAAVRRFRPAARIIASGGSGSLPPVEPAVVAKRLGVHSALPKPYGVEGLKAAIAAALADDRSGSPRRAC